MIKYKCYYTDELGATQRGDTVVIQAENPEHAADNFVKTSNSRGSHVCVCWGFGRYEVFPAAGWEEEEEKRQKEESHTIIQNQINKAKKYLAILEGSLNLKTKTRSYFELPSDVRLIMSNYLNDLIIEFESRGLEPIEIKFIEAWLEVKDRSLGESLIAKRVSALPPAQRQNSKFANMMLLGMVANTMRLENALDDVSDEISSIGEDVSEMQEDVGDMNEGFGFEE